MFYYYTVASLILSGSSYCLLNYQNTANIHNFHMYYNPGRKLCTTEQTTLVQELQCRNSLRSEFTHKNSLLFKNMKSPSILPCCLSSSLPIWHSRLHANNGTYLSTSSSFRIVLEDDAEKSELERSRSLGDEFT
jgi:hypothetical protein